MNRYGQTRHFLAARAEKRAFVIRKKKKEAEEKRKYDAAEREETARQMSVSCAHAHSCINYGAMTRVMVKSARPYNPSLPIFLASTMTFACKCVCKFWSMGPSCEFLADGKIQPEKYETKAARRDGIALLLNLTQVELAEGGATLTSELTASLKNAETKMVPMVRRAQTQVLGRRSTCAFEGTVDIKTEHECKIAAARLGLVYGGAHAPYTANKKGIHYCLQEWTHSVRDKTTAATSDVRYEFPVPGAKKDAADLLMPGNMPGKVFFHAPPPKDSDSAVELQRVTSQSPVCYAPSDPVPTGQHARQRAADRLTEQSVFTRAADTQLAKAEKLGKEGKTNQENIMDEGAAATLSNCHGLCYDFYQPPEQGLNARLKDEAKESGQGGKNRYYGPAYAYFEGRSRSEKNVKVAECNKMPFHFRWPQLRVHCKKKDPKECTAKALKTNPYAVTKDTGESCALIVERRTMCPISKKCAENWAEMKDRWHTPGGDTCAGEVHFVGHGEAHYPTVYKVANSGYVQYLDELAKGITMLRTRNPYIAGRAPWEAPTQGWGSEKTTAAAKCVYRGVARPCPFTRGGKGYPFNFVSGNRLKRISSYKCKSQDVSKYGTFVTEKRDWAQLAHDILVADEGRKFPHAYVQKPANQACGGEKIGTTPTFLVDRRKTCIRAAMHKGLKYRGEYGWHNLPSAEVAHKMRCHFHGKKSAKKFCGANDIKDYLAKGEKEWQVAQPELKVATLPTDAIYAGKTKTVNGKFVRERGRSFRVSLEIGAAKGTKSKKNLVVLGSPPKPAWLVKDPNGPNPMGSLYIAWQQEEGPGNMGRFEVGVVGNNLPEPKKKKGTSGVFNYQPPGCDPKKGCENDLTKQLEIEIAALDDEIKSSRLGVEAQTKRMKAAGNIAKKAGAKKKKASDDYQKKPDDQKTEDGFAKIENEINEEEDANFRELCGGSGASLIEVSLKTGTTALGLRYRGGTKKETPAPYKFSGSPCNCDRGSNPKCSPISAAMKFIKSHQDVHRNKKTADTKTRRRKKAEMAKIKKDLSVELRKSDPPVLTSYDFDATRSHAVDVVYNWQEVHVYVGGKLAAKGVRMWKFFKTGHVSLLAGSHTTKKKQPATGFEVNRLEISDWGGAPPHHHGGCVAIANPVMQARKKNPTVVIFNERNIVHSAATPGESPLCGKGLLPEIRHQLRQLNPAVMPAGALCDGKTSTSIHSAHRCHAASRALHVHWGGTARDAATGYARTAGLTGCFRAGPTGKMYFDARLPWENKPGAAPQAVGTDLAVCTTKAAVIPTHSQLHLAARPDPGACGFFCKVKKEHNYAVRNWAWNVVDRERTEAWQRPYMSCKLMKGFDEKGHAVDQQMPLIIKRCRFDTTNGAPECRVVSTKGVPNGWKQARPNGHVWDSNASWQTMSLDELNRAIGYKMGWIGTQSKCPPGQEKKRGGPRMLLELEARREASAASLSLLETNMAVGATKVKADDADDDADDSDLAAAETFEEIDSEDDDADDNESAARVAGAAQTAADAGNDDCYILYCNMNSGLAKSLCGGYCRAVSVDHASKCKEHWEKYGKKEGRTGDPTTCLAAAVADAKAYVKFVNKSPEEIEALRAQFARDQNGPQEVNRLRKLVHLYHWIMYDAALHKSGIANSTALGGLELATCDKLDKLRVEAKTHADREAALRKSGKELALAKKIFDDRDAHMSKKYLAKDGANEAIEAAGQKMRAVLGQARDVKAALLLERSAAKTGHLHLAKTSTHTSTYTGNAPQALERCIDGIKLPGTKPQKFVAVGDELEAVPEADGANGAKNEFTEAVRLGKSTWKVKPRTEKECCSGKALQGVSAAATELKDLCEARKAVDKANRYCPNNAPNCGFFWGEGAVKKTKLNPAMADAAKKGGLLAKPAGKKGGVSTEIVQGKARSGKNTKMSQEVPAKATAEITRFVSEKGAAFAARTDAHKAACRLGQETPECTAKQTHNLVDLADGIGDVVVSILDGVAEQGGPAAVSANKVVKRLMMIVKKKVTGLLGSGLAKKFKVGQIELPKIAVASHTPSYDDFASGDDAVFVLVKSETEGFIDSFMVMMTYGYWQEERGGDPDMDVPPVFTIGASFKSPFQAIGLGGLLDVLPSLKYVKMGFVISSEDVTFGAGGIPEDVPVPDMLTGRLCEELSTSPSILGTFNVPQDAACGADPICALMKVINGALGPARVEVDMTDEGFGVTIITGEVWFSNTLGLQQIEVGLGVGADGVEIEALASILYCVANCDQEVDEKESLMFTGRIGFQIPDMVLGIHMAMAGYFTFPAPMDFITVGMLDLGGEIAFAPTFTPESFHFGGEICLDSTELEGRKRLGASGLNKNERCSAETSITAKVYGGMSKGDPDGNYIYLRIQNLSLKRILALFMDTSSVPAFLLNTGELNFEISYSVLGIDPSHPAIDGTGIELEVPAGFACKAEIKNFLLPGFGASFKIIIDEGVSAEMEFAMKAFDMMDVPFLKPLKFFGMGLQLRRSPNDKDNGPFLRGYLGMTPTAMLGNGDWCDGMLCVEGAGYMKMSILGLVFLEGYFSTTIAVNPIKLSATLEYELRDAKFLGGLFEANVEVGVGLNLKDPSLNLKASIKIGNLYQMMVEKLAAIVKIVYKALMAIMDLMSMIVAKAELFVEMFLTPIREPLKIASKGLKDLYFMLRSPFESAAKGVASIRGCTSQHALLQLDESDHPHFNMLLEDWASRNKLPEHSAFFMNREDANSFLVVSEHQEWGFVDDAIESASEAVQAVAKAIAAAARALAEKIEEACEAIIEIAKEVAERVIEAGLLIACATANIALSIAFLALKPISLLYQLLDKMVEGVEAIPALLLKGVNLFIGVLRTAITAVFGTFIDALESDDIAAFTGILDKIFSIQELSMGMDWSMEKPVPELNLGILASIVGINVDLNFKVDPTSPIPPQIIMQMFWMIVEKIFPGMKEVRMFFEKMEKEVTKVFEGVMNTAKKSIKSVVDFISDIENVI